MRTTKELDDWLSELESMSARDRAMAWLGSQIEGNEEFLRPWKENPDYVNDEHLLRVLKQTELRTEVLSWIRNQLQEEKR